MSPEFIDLPPLFTEDAKSFHKIMSGGAKKCPPGKILRKGASRQSYQRQAYVRKDGTRVAATQVKASTMKSTCIKDIGEPGKGKKLFQLKRNVLRPYGYSLSKSAMERQKSIRQAVKNKGALEVLRHLVALRTLARAVPKNEKKFNQDVLYMRRTYYPERLRKEQSKKKSSNRRKSKRKSSKKKKKEKPAKENRHIIYMRSRKYKIVKTGGARNIKKQKQKSRKEDLENNIKHKGPHRVLKDLLRQVPFQRTSTDQDKLESDINWLQKKYFNQRQIKDGFEFDIMDLDIDTEERIGEGLKTGIDYILDESPLDTDADLDNVSLIW